MVVEVTIRCVCALLSVISQGVKSILITFIDFLDFFRIVTFLLDCVVSDLCR